MAFQFPLTAVLRVRENTERREEGVLNKIRAEMVHTERQAAELRTAMDARRRDREQALSRCMAGGMLQALLREEHGIEERLRGLLAHLQVLEQERQRQLKVYQAVHRDREILSEMLKKQREAFEREQMREEQKRLDDIFTARRLRN
jgi:flagellar export protein FliJ